MKYQQPTRSVYFVYEHVYSERECSFIGFKTCWLFKCVNPYMVGYVYSYMQTCTYFLLLN
jgi:hypothetical protein